LTGGKVSPVPGGDAARYAESVADTLRFQDLPTRVVLYVKRWDESLRFYVETLGLRPAYPPRRGWAELRLAGTSLCLQEGRVSDITTEEICKVGWRVDDLDAARAALEARGVAVQEPQAFGAYRICHFYDPDDNALFLEGR
jgi:catechol 2,3-dioxygenase-like lactoylglutathione lyase family enzyme